MTDKKDNVSKYKYKQSSKLVYFVRSGPPRAHRRLLSPLLLPSLFSVPEKEQDSVSQLTPGYMSLRTNYRQSLWFIV